MNTLKEVMNLFPYGIMLGIFVLMISGVIIRFAYRKILSDSSRNSRRRFDKYFALMALGCILFFIGLLIVLGEAGKYIY